MHSALEILIQAQGVAILDGGLATELEGRGHDLSSELWSARLLQDDPQVIADVHTAYLEAGADIIVSAGYQATIEGFRRIGLSDEVAARLLQRAVQVAQSARDMFAAHLPSGRLPPAVAAGIGPYGAFLADGSEYTGVYDRDEEALLDFHRRRWHLLATLHPELIACETIPNFAELRALATLSAETNIPVWISLSCRDEGHLQDGTPVTTCAAWLEAYPHVVGIGVNCTAPSRIARLLERLRDATAKHLIVYPNSGEGWDAQNRCWIGERDPVQFAQLARHWRELGAAVIGGCCRTSPDTVRALRSALLAA